jgi:hypothetical protein
MRFAFSETKQHLNTALGGNESLNIDRYIKASSEIVQGRIVSRKRTPDGQVDQW